ncbi:MAG: hypothetical protein GX750_02755 [Clostridia bacterium]|nr:hypothetical protein [Clostridia bacterium]
MTVTKKKRIKKNTAGKGFFPLKQVLILLVLGLIVWLNWDQVRLLMIKPFIRYYMVETGSVTQELAIDRAVVIRDETVLFAPRTGILKRLVPEGQRVAEGEAIAHILSPYGDRQPVLAVRPGVVSYYTDGLENVLRPEMMETINLSDLELRSHSLREALDGTTVEPGEPIAKIVDNLQPFLIWLEFDVEHWESFPLPGKKISLFWGDGEYEGQVMKVTARGISAEAILSFHREDFLWDREVSIRLVLAKEKGMKIPNEALVMEREETGVFKGTAKGHRWTPVTVKLQNEEFCIVEGLKRGDRIITNPQLLMEE